MIVSALMVMALAYFIINLTIRIRNNVIAGRSYRQALRSELASLRFDRMLNALGIDREIYLHSHHRHELYQHMQCCHDCSHIDVCDEKLCQQNIDVDDIDYCNNADALKAMVSQQKSISI